MVVDARSDAVNRADKGAFAAGAIDKKQINRALGLK